MVVCCVLIRIACFCFCYLLVVFVLFVVCFLGLHNQNCLVCFGCFSVRVLFCVMFVNVFSVRKSKLFPCSPFFCVCG